MRIKIISSLAIVLASFFLFVAIEYFWARNHSIIRSLSIEKPLEVVTPAFTAHKYNAMWVITLDPAHFTNKILSVAISYNDNLYGIFLLTDKIILPALEALRSEVVISSLDENGEVVNTEAFTLHEWGK